MNELRLKRVTEFENKKSYLCLIPKPSRWECGQYFTSAMLKPGFFMVGIAVCAMENISAVYELPEVEEGRNNRFYNPERR